MATALPALATPFTLAEVARATGGTLAGAPDAAVRGVSTDTRALAAGALFVALAGETHDGHDHLAAALAAGAGALLVRRGTAPAGVPAVLVDDTLRALGDLARYHLERERGRRGAGDPLRVIAITGSAGKTTTKELAAAAAAAAFGPCHATRGNLNNLVGAPLTVLGIGPEHRVAVVETGTSAHGEIPRLGEIVAPDVGVVLNADTAHTQGLGSADGVAREKGALFQWSRRAMVGNADDRRSSGEMVRGTGEAWLFGEAPEAHVRLAARAVAPDGRARLTVRFDARRADTPELAVALSLLGRAAAVDACAALAAVAAAGAAGDGLVAAAGALAGVEAPPGRMRVVEMRGLRVIDDTYNANPRSVAMALEAAAELARGLGARLVVALGEMRELGAQSREEHARAGARVRASGAAAFVAVGPEMAAGADAARGPAPSPVVVAHVADAAAAGAALRALVRPGDVVLVKGSRGVAMERALEALREGGR